jgi:predicted nucleotidyltransferase
MNRSRDWWHQASRDVAHAQHAVDDGDYEWAAFAAQQAAEKAVKAVVLAQFKHYIPARYPNGFAAGYPGKLCTRGEAEQARMHSSSSSSAGATYLNKDQRIAEIRAAAGRAARRMASIQQIWLFGSLVRGIPTPRSDADLLVVLDHSPHARPADRLPEMLQALAALPGPVDVFVVSRDEFDRARETPLVREVLGHGIQLL